ncbi:MAG: hypothetical protein ACK5JF_02175 [Oscillospiraceae bacterium]
MARGVMHLRYETMLEYKAWHKKLLSMTAAAIPFLLLAEVLIFAIKKWQGNAGNTAEYLWIYMARPTLYFLSVLGVAALASFWLVKHKKYAAQALVYVTGLVLLCSGIAWTHSAVDVIFAVFFYRCLFHFLM